MYCPYKTIQLTIKKFIIAMSIIRNIIEFSSWISPVLNRACLLQIIPLTISIVHFQNLLEKILMVSTIYILHNRRNSWQRKRECIFFFRDYAIMNLKFIYSEKASKFCEIFTLLLTTVHTVKSKVKISQNFVAFSEYMNFIKNEYLIKKQVK